MNIPEEEQAENTAVQNTLLGLLVNLSRYISDDYTQKYKSEKLSLDRKLRKMIQDKKQALGIKEEQSY